MWLLRRRRQHPPTPLCQGGAPPCRALIRTEPQQGSSRRGWELPGGGGVTSWQVRPPATAGPADAPCRACSAAAPPGRGKPCSCHRTLQGKGAPPVPSEAACVAPGSQPPFPDCERPQSSPGGGTSLPPPLGGSPSALAPIARALRGGARQPRCGGRRLGPRRPAPPPCELAGAPRRRRLGPDRLALPWRGGVGAAPSWWAGGQPSGPSVGGGGAEAARASGCEQVRALSVCRGVRGGAGRRGSPPALLLPGQAGRKGEGAALRSALAQKPLFPRRGTDLAARGDGLRIGLLGWGACGT